MSYSLLWSISHLARELFIVKKKKNLNLADLDFLIYLLYNLYINIKYHFLVQPIFSLE